MRAACIVSGLFLASGPLYAAFALQSRNVDPDGARFEAPALFGQVAHTWLDRDCDEDVTIEELTRAFGMAEDDPRTTERSRDFDPDGNGLVSPGEIAEGILLGVAEQVSITMLVDADEDGGLSLEEHALGFPDVGGEQDEGGFTPRQRESFRFFDEDANGKVSPEEVTRKHTQTYFVMYWASMVAHLFAQADRDQDGRVRLPEFLEGLGLSSTTELSEEQRNWYDVLSNDIDEASAIELRVFRVQLLQDRPVSSRMRMERPIRSLLVPSCSRSKGY